MTAKANRLIWSARKLGIFGLGSFAIAATLMSFGSGTSSADVEEVAPAPVVTSRQALIVSDNALRASAPGEARGALETRSADSGIVHAQGELRDSVKAVVGTTAAPFGVEQNGAFVEGAPIGDW